MSQNRSNFNQNDNLRGESEISLLDFLRFFKSAYKTILIFGALGIVAGIVYLAITPKEYEARAQIAMAQIAMAQIGTTNNIAPLGINIEEPALLIARLSNPSSFTPEMFAACGVDDKSDIAVALAKIIKLSPAKGIPNVVDLKSFGASPEIAKACANTLFDFTKKTQAETVAPYVEEAKGKLADDEQRINRLKEWILRSDKGASPMSATYLSTRDEIQYLLDEMTGLKNFLAINQNRGTRLVAPIYASNVAIAPKKSVALGGGLFGGLLLGLLIALGRQMAPTLRSQKALY